MSAPIIKRTCTRIHRIAIERLKGICQLDEISFEDKPLTGIFGPNGNGKSTVLHALAAAYQAPEYAKGSHYWTFFPKLDQDLWNGTRFVVNHSGTLSTGAAFANFEERYSKGTVTTRWKPLEGRRPIREVVYIGLKSCLPALERYSWHDLSGAVSTPLVEKPDLRALAALGKILNCNYTAVSRLTLADYPTRRYVSFDRADRGTYPSVTMGAGEQRLFELLSVVERTRKNALVLIDEIDALIHGDALSKLIDYLFDHCTEKEKQMVFTSHREALLDLGEWINIRHLYWDATQAPARNRCFDFTDPDSLRRLTGNRVRTLEVFVEDDVAEMLVSQVTTELGMSRHVKIYRFGAATNCFSVLAGLLMKGEPCENSLFLLDGDVYRHAGDRQTQIERACSGNDPAADSHRTEMAIRIQDFELPPDHKPESYLHRLIVTQDPATLGPQETEIQKAAKEIVNPLDGHGFIYHLLTVLGENRAVQLTRVVPLAAKHEDWAAYTQPVRTWLQQRKAAMHLQ